ncbi:MAG: TetR/AcrR family transcriptional regulator [Actinobacteria bacterium]|nr:TetR/AcrR family transcriptional regulator [Actinomycetota bacterium]
MTDRLSGRRGRPRDSAIDSRVLDAAWDLLHAKGFAGLTVDEVAERAGAAKTTVYRRWPTKDHLATALAARILGEIPIADTGDLRADLTAFAAALAGSLNRLRLAGTPASAPSAGLAAELAAAAARHPDIGELVRAGFAARHALARARLQHARDTEGLRGDIDAEVLIDQVAGPLWYRVLVTGAPADRSYAERLVTAALDGAFTADLHTARE